MARQFNFTEDEINRMETLGLWTPEQASAMRSRINMSVDPNIVTQERLAAQAAAQEIPNPNRDLQGWENVEYGIGKIAEPFVAPFQGRVGAAGQVEYDNALRDSIIANRMPQAQAQNVQQNQAQPVDQSVVPDQQAQPAEQATQESTQVQQNQTQGQRTQGSQTGKRDPNSFFSQNDKFNNNVNKATDEMDKIQKITLDINNDFKTKMDNLTKESDKLAQTPFNDFWSTKTTGQKLTAAMAILGGALANFYQGGPAGQNQALELIKKEIDNDFEKQKLEYTKKDNALSRAMGNLKSMRDAEMAYYGAAYDNVKQKMELYLKGENLKNAQRQLDIMAQEKLSHGIKATQADMKIDGDNRLTLANYNENRGQLENDLKGLDRAINILEKGKGSFFGGVSGPVDKLKPNIVNQNSKIIANLVGDVKSRDLRNTLGAQFTEGEGARLLGYAYDPSLQEEENIAQIKKLRDGIRNRMNYLDGMQKYYQQTGRTYDYVPPKTNMQKREALGAKPYNGNGK